MSELHFQRNDGQFGKPVLIRLEADEELTTCFFSAKTPAHRVPRPPIDIPLDISPLTFVYVCITLYSSVHVFEVCDV